MTKNLCFMTRLLAAVLAVVMLSSAVYLAVEADHDCSGDDCAICRQISICENLLKSLGLAGAAAASKTVLFGDRFPFRYLVDDYGLRYYAAFAGCSAETEASFETVSFLAKKVDELGLPCVLTIEGKNHKLAETIVQSTAGKNQKVLTMDSMQSMTSKDAANGATYLSVMEQNLSVLKEALG